jgi:hypothetical protein
MFAVIVLFESVRELSPCSFGVLMWTILPKSCTNISELLLHELLRSNVRSNHHSTSHVFASFADRRRVAVTTRWAQPHLSRPSRLVGVARLSREHSAFVCGGDIG